MSEFKNVTVVREANVFFNGGVVSRTVLFADGSKKTLGLMQPGSYEFSTKTGEEMEILWGISTCCCPAGARGCRSGAARASAWGRAKPSR